jgi:hypothetical protein
VETHDRLRRRRLTVQLGLCLAMVVVPIVALSRPPASPTRRVAAGDGTDVAGSLSWRSVLPAPRLADALLPLSNPVSTTTAAPPTTARRPAVRPTRATTPTTRRTPTTVRSASRSAPVALAPATTAAPTHSQTGGATYYAAPDGTCAHRTLPFGTLVRVTDLANGRTVTCRVADRGPYVSGRILDLAKTTFAQLAPTSTGVIQVRIEW